MYRLYWAAHTGAIAPQVLFEEAGVEVRQSEMFDRERLEGSAVRERMIHDDPWRPLVPDAVVEVIGEIDGITRIQQVAETDSNGD